MQQFIIVGRISKEVLHTTDDHNKAIDWIAANFPPDRWKEFGIYQKVEVDP